MRRLIPTKSRFVQDSFILQISGMGVAASQLVSALVIAHQLGSDGQGLYVSGLKLYALFVILTTGVYPAVVSQIGAAVTRNQKEKIAAWQAFVIKAYFTFGLLFFGVGALLLPSIAEQWFENETLGYWAWWLCLTPLLELGRLVASATFQGTRRMGELARLDLGTELGRASLIIGSVFIWDSAQAAVIATLVSSAWASLLGLTLYRWSSKRHETSLPGLRSILNRVRDVPLSVGVPLSFRMGFLRSLDALAFDILPPLFLLAAGISMDLSNAENQVGYFNTAQKIMLVPVTLLAGVGRNALPTLSGVAGRKDPEAFRRGFLRITVFGGLVTLGGIALALLAMPYVVGLIWPSDYKQPVAVLASILAIGYVIKGFSSGFDSFFMLTDRLKVAMTFSGLSMLFSFPMMYWLTLQFPRTGAAWGVVANFSWGLLHYLYILWFFRTKQYLTLFQDKPPIAHPPKT